MSRFRADSELTRLNLARGGNHHVSRLLANALCLAERARRVTDGRFDPRVVGALERLGFDAVPQAWDGRGEASRPVLSRHGCRGPIELSAAVDLGGLGKGLALRRAAAVVSRRLGGEPYLLDAGGDIVTGGSAFPWSIGIEDPAGGGEPLATVSIAAGWAVATSSTRLARRQAVGGGEDIHHLVDPATGRPGGAGLAAVTVAWRDPAWAEVWSKALFLEGPAGIGPAARARGLAAWWVDARGTLSMTPAARQVTTWVRAEAGLSPP